MPKKFQNSNELNSLSGKINSVATTLNKKNVSIKVERVIPEGKNSEPFIRVSHEQSELRFSAAVDGDRSFRDIKREISNHFEL